MPILPSLAKLILTEDRYLQLKFSLRTGWRIRFQNRHHKASDCLLIFGSARGGTTWLAEILGPAIGGAVLWEPFNPNGYRRRTHWQRRLDPFPYRRNFEEWPWGVMHIMNILALQALTPWQLAHYGTGRATSVAHWVVKFVRGNLLLPWIARHIPTTYKPILLIRNPLSVVASRLHHHGWQNPDNLDYEATPEAFIANRKRFFDTHPHYKSLLRRNWRTEEWLAASWAIDTLVPLTESDCSLWTTVFYEDLVTHGAAIVSWLLRERGMPIPDDIASRLKAPSMTTKSDSNVIQHGDPLTTWRKRLSNSQAQSIQSVVRDFGVNIYNEEGLPDYSHPLIKPKIETSHPWLTEAEHGPVHR